MISQQGQSVAMTKRAQDVANRIDSAVLWFATHWLAVFIGYGMTVAGLAMSAPLLKAGGFGTLAQVVYLPFRVICHQRDDRSFHLYGEKLAFCQRDLAIVAAAIGMGLAFAVVRHWPGLRTIRFAVVVALAMPMAIDGTTQLFGLRESTPELRLLTGTLFSIGVAWFVLPHLEAGFASIREEILVRRRTFASDRSGAE